MLDVRGGLKNGRIWIEKVKKRCNLVLAGKIDEVWKEACEIENKRPVIRSKKTNRRNKNGIKILEEHKKSSKEIEMKIDSPNLLKKDEVIHGPEKSCNKKKDLGDEDDCRVNDDGDETWKFLDLSIRKLPKDRMRAYLAAKNWLTWVNSPRRCLSSKR